MVKRIYILFFLLISPAVLGANEICVALGGQNSGLSLSAAIRQPSTDYLYDDVNGFEATMPDANSGVELTESSNTKGTYYGTFPSGISAGSYDIYIYDSNTANLDFNDTQLMVYEFNWDGSAKINGYTNYVLQQEIVVDTGTTLPAAIADVPTDTNDLITAAHGSGTYVSEINDVDVKSYVAEELEDYNSPTKSEFDAGIAAIQAKTDNLPTDPADDSDIDTQLAAIKSVDVNDIADVVWDEALSEHQTPGTAGHRLDHSKRR